MKFAVPSLGDSPPKSWRRPRNREVFKVVDDRSELGDEELLTVSHLTGVTSRAEKTVTMFQAETLEGYKRCKQGDLVINTMWAWMGALGVTPIDGIVSPSYHVYRFRTPELHEPRFFDYLYRTSAYVVEITRNSRGVWTSRLRLYPEEFLDMEVWVPPLEVQRDIVDFLDRKCAAIDALIGKKRKLIQLLVEKRAALINQAVTKGLDPTVPMKDSGIPWVGEIPAHWELRKLAHSVFTTGSGTTPEKIPLYFNDGGVPWITSSELRETTIYRSKHSVTERAFSRYSALKVFPRNSILIAMYGATIGRLGILGKAACCNQACCAIVRPHHFSVYFLFWLLLAARDHLVFLGSGGGQPNISQDKIRELRLPGPCKAEQQAIIEHVEALVSPLQQLDNALRLGIDKLQEYRQALITAAVTGQLEIPVEESVLEEVLT